MRGSMRSRFGRWFVTMLALGVLVALACLARWNVATEEASAPAPSADGPRSSDARELEQPYEGRARASSVDETTATTWLVLGCDGRPLASADLEVHDVEHVVHLTTNGDGRMRAPDWTLATTGVHVRHGERELERVADGSGSEPTLRTAPRLRGRVLSPHNAAWIANARVVLVPGSTERQGRDLPPRLLDDPAFVRPVLDARGEFSLCDLEPGRWTVRAACSDAVAGPQDVDVLPGGGAAIELALRPAAGIAVRLVDASGTPPKLTTRTSPLGTWTEADFRSSQYSAGWDSLMDGPALAVLAGMNPELAGSGPGEFVWLFAGDSELPSDARIRLAASAPGLGRLTAELEPVRPAALQAFRDVAFDGPPGRGTLVVRIGNVPDCPRPASLALPEFVLGLRNLDAPKLASIPLVLEVIATEQVFPDVPAGRYRAHGLQLANLLLPGKLEHDLTIEDGGTTRLELDAGATGCIVLRPEIERGGAYEGLLRVVIRGKHTPRGQIVQMVHFRGPPYSLPFQPPGAFVADISTGEAEDQTVTATCEAGRSAEVRFTVAPR